MTASPEFCLNQASAPQIAAHLRVCDRGFVPPLSERVAIDDYARKIAEKAQRFEAWAGGDLVGLVAAYCTDPEKRAAFITSVSVAPAWQGRGIASQLLERCQDLVRNLGFGRIDLEVDSRSTAAVALYEKHGFKMGGSDGPLATMYWLMDRRE